MNKIQEEKNSQIYFLRPRRFPDPIGAFICMHYTFQSIDMLEI